MKMVTTPTRTTTTTFDSSMVWASPQTKSNSKNTSYSKTPVPTSSMS